MLRLFSLLTFLSVVAGSAAEPPMPAAERAKMIAELNEDISTLTRAIQDSPRNIALFSRRGDAHLFTGCFAEAIADFERMIALDPAQDAPHWRLGIAYYFAGEFHRSARQFEKYHTYDARDRENGIWKFLGDVRVHGLERARRTMLVYSRFDREPFPALYAMFAGTQTTAEFLADLEGRRLTDDPQVMFFANYYAGLNEELLGRRDSALALVRAAVASPWGRGTSERRLPYMWQVARIHYEVLSAKP